MLPAIARKQKAVVFKMVIGIRNTDRKDNPLPKLFKVIPSTCPGLYDWKERCDA